MEECQLCEREVSKTTRHHLTPLQKGGKHTETIPLCQPCHATLHATYTNATLARELNTVEKLKAAPGLQKYLSWIRNKKLERLTVKKKN